MKIKYYLFLFTVFVSCQKEELATEFRNEIIKYQKEIPLPVSAEKYLYVGSFSRVGNDTLFNLIRCPGLSKYDTILGVYQDSSLKPLAIIDNKNIGKNFIHVKRKNHGIQNYISIRPKEDFPPLYRYKVKNNKIILIKIDTISNRWEK